jgi:hypothetical protein
MMEPIDEQPARPEGVIYWRPLPDGYEITVHPMTFGKARLCYGPQESITHENGFCYADRALALEAAAVWDGHGDPLNGWHRNPFTGRRRENGDPAKEERYW